MWIIVTCSLIIVGGLMIWRFYKVLVWFPATPFGFFNLQKYLRQEGFEYTSNVHIVKIFGLLMIMGFLIWIFQLNLYFSLIFLTVGLAFLPIMILWRYQFLKQEAYFNQLITYTQHFIACFKQQPKTFTVLQECLIVFENSSKQVLVLAIENIKNGKSIQFALAGIAKVYPHFIVLNLHSLAVAVELYGASEYLESLDILQNDTDDLIEDVLAFKNEQLRMKNRLQLLICFAMVLAGLVKNMLMQIAINTTDMLYQSTVFSFVLLLFVTYLMSQRIYRHSWLNRDELR